MSVKKLPILLLAILVNIHAVSASTWSPTLLVNTEAFQVLDEGDGASDIYLQFGDTVNQRLTYETTAERFTFSDDVFIDQNNDEVALHIDSEATTEAGLQIDIAGDGDSPHLLFGQSGTFDVNLYRQAANILRTDDSMSIGGFAHVSGTLSGNTVHAVTQLRSSGSLAIDGATQFNNVAYTWPSAAATSSGDVLKVDPASGQLSWGPTINRQTTTGTTTDNAVGGTNTVTDISIPVSANTNYFIQCRFTTTAAATTTGVQMTLNGPAAPTQLTWSRESCSSATATIGASINAFATEDARTASAGATRCIEDNHVHLRNGANAGNITFSLDTEVGGSAVNVLPGSFCEWRAY